MRASIGVAYARGVDTAACSRSGRSDARSVALSKKSAWMHGSWGTAASVLSSPSGRSGFGIKLRSKSPTTSTISVVRSCSALSTSASLSSAVILGCSGIGVRSEACVFFSSL